MEKRQIEDIADWMLDRVEEAGQLSQKNAAWHIADRYGHPFVYRNGNGNLAIHPAILKEFRDSDDGNVVWVASKRIWRLRSEDDTFSRKQ